MNSHKYLVALVLLAACSDNPVEVEPAPATIEGSWRGSFVNLSYMKGGTPRTDTFEIEFIQRSDNTVAGAGMWERWFDSEFDQRSYLALEGVFADPNLSVNGNTFWGLITLRGPLDGEVLHVTKNGVDKFELRRQ